MNELLHVLINDPFERQICEIPNILIVMFDGFDEISPDYKDIVTEFLQNLRSMKNVNTVIVTTRRHLKEHLELHLEFPIVKQVAQVLIKIGTNLFHGEFSNF